MCGDNKPNLSVFTFSLINKIIEKHITSNISFHIWEELHSLAAVTPAKYRHDLATGLQGPHSFLWIKTKDFSGTFPGTNKMS